MENLEMKKLKKKMETEFLYNLIKEYCEVHNYRNSLVALPFAREVHEGKYRRGEDQAPYLIHPLRVAEHSILLGLSSDIEIATSILHDTKEEKNECDLANLAIDDKIKFYVDVLTFTNKKFPTIPEKRKAQSAYYERIKQYEVTTFRKLIDRRDCLSTMPKAFKKEKMFDYFDETRTFYPDLIRNAKGNYSDKLMQIHSLENDINSYIDTISGVWEMADEEYSLKLEKKVS